jgi:O-antigen/teichoic acid export membrane protein
MRIGQHHIDGALVQRFIAEGVTKGSALILAFLLARWLAAEGFGGYSQTQALVAVLVPIVLLGLGFAIIRQIAGATNATDIAAPITTAFLLVSIISLGLAVAMWATAPRFAGEFSNHPSAIALVRAAAILLPIAAWQILLSEALRARQRVRTATLLQISESLLSLTGIVLLWFLGNLTPVTAIILIAILKVFFLLCAAGDLVRSQAIGPSQIRLLSRRDVQAALALGIPFMIAGLGESLMGMVDRVLIGSLAGSETVGRYVAAQTLIAILASWGAPYWWLLYPRMARAMTSGLRTEAIAITHRLFGNFITFAAPLAVLLAILGPQILTLAVGESFQISPVTMPILVLAIFINQSATPWEYSLYISGKAVFLMWTSLFWGFAAVVGIVVLLPSYGVLGAAISVASARLGFAIAIIIGAGRAGLGAELLPRESTLRTLVALLLAILVVAIGSITTTVVQNPWTAALLFVAAYALSDLTMRLVQARQRAN